MRKIYLFQANEPINRDVFDQLIKALIPETDIFYEDDKNGSFVADSLYEPTLENNIFSIHQTLGVRISILAVHKLDNLTAHCRKGALDYFPNQCVFLTDILYKRTSFGDYYYVHYLKEEFDNVPDEILETAGAFLRCGLNGIETAKMLGIHRNTFNYRLKEFIELTDCDIRDYHNALLLELFFQFAKRR